MNRPTLHFQRFEFKYYLSKSTADKLIPALISFMDWDPYVQKGKQGSHSYKVTSLYYDTYDFSCFWDKESGIADRKKLRLRFYNNLTTESDIFVEIKRKQDALVVKDRVAFGYSKDIILKLDEKLKQMLAIKPHDEFLHELFWFKKRNNLSPKLCVSYDRKALVGRKNKNFRVTFDYNMKAWFSSHLNPGMHHTKNIFPEGVTLELKYNNILPSWFHRIIQRYQLQRLAFSKYCNALRVANPILDDGNYIV